MVIIHNMKIEQSLEYKKVEPWYLGPYKIVRRTPGGSYVIEELDGAVLRIHIAAFRLLPYVARDPQALQNLAEPAELDMDLSQDPSSSGSAEDDLDSIHSSD